MILQAIPINPFIYSIELSVLNKLCPSSTIFWFLMESRDICQNLKLHKSKTNTPTFKLETLSKLFKITF